MRVENVIDLALILAGIMIAYYAIPAFFECLYKVKNMKGPINKRPKPKARPKLTEYDKFLTWLKTEKKGMTFTKHQCLYCEANLNGVTIESLGGRSDAMGVKFVLTVLNEYKRETE